jgi:peptidyl-prolyl cis-trans isomerase D
MLGYLRSGNRHTKMIWWAITIATVFTFLLGFSFFGSMGRDPSLAARQSGSFGSVNGESVTRQMWQMAVASERDAFRQRFGSEPVDRDLRALEQQAWRKLVNNRLMAQAANKAGIQVTDNDIVFGMQVNPPAAILSASAFQTDGKFDPQKYRSALANPGNDWSQFETQMRLEMPATKLQERLISSLKLSDGELREAFRDRFERLTATVVQIPPSDTGSSPGSEAELQRVYEKYRSRMASPARTQLEVLAILMQYSPEEIKVAMDLAGGLYQRVNKGEDFAQLCRDYSEGAGAEKGGVIDRFVSPAEMGPIGQQIQSHKPGDVLPPYREGGTVMLFRILDPARDSVARGAPPGSVKLAQITVKVHGNPESIRKQYAAALQLAKRAKAVGLSRAATEKGIATMKTGFFNYENMPPLLFATPEAADWGLTHKKGEVSPVFQGPEQFVIAEVSTQHAAGPPERSEIGDQIKQIADMEHRLDLARPRADRVAAAIKGGASLEDAARAAGLAAMPVSLTRAEPDPRLTAAPEFQGALWAAKPGQVVGPIRTSAGWFLGRPLTVSQPPDSLWKSEQTRGQLTSDVLSRRQRSFFTGYLEMLRHDARIVDARDVAAGY